jgi:methylmalonyl-CoA mutase cobalamin-binding subunit
LFCPGQKFDHREKTHLFDPLAPLNVRIGEAWMTGEIAVHDEHFYTEHVQNTVRTAIRQLEPRERGPRVLLTTLPREQHGLGLLMVEGLLASDDAPCISLGTQTPVQDIVTASRAHRADVVALSFSAGFPVRRGAEAIATLRDALDQAVELWVGGRMVLRLRDLGEGIHRITGLDGVSPAVATWRESRRGRPGGSA